jgi:hypothetical protein
MAKAARCRLGFPTPTHCDQCDGGIGRHTHYGDEAYEWIAREFEDPTLKNSLIRSIQRDYAFILEKGFRIEVNGSTVLGTMPTLRLSEEVAPIKIEYADDGVQVQIVAGLAAPPSEDDSPQQRYPEAAPPTAAESGSSTSRR